MSESRPVRILSNTRWFEGRRVGGRPVVGEPLPEEGAAALLRAYLRARSADAVVFNVASRPLLVFCLLKRLLGLGRARLVSVDLILNRPPARGRRRLEFVLKRWLLGAVDLFVLYYPDTAELRRLYGWPASRFAYVPFKVNDLEAVRAVAAEDRGYVFSAGRSKRDYATLLRALEGLPEVKATILAPPASDAIAHGSPESLHRVPPNVSVVTDDGSADSWREWMRGAHFLVLPIIPDTLAPSGISTYLMAMALGKCVVITDSPATRGILTDREAVIVPPADVDALRAAIARVWNDPEHRRRVAEGGRAYAVGLGGEERLAADVLEALARIGVA